MTTNNKIKVWDFPIRLFHWVTVGLLGGLWWSGETGEMSLHQVLAYILMALLVFRIIWGFIGSDTARFGQFVRSPKDVYQYATSKHKSESVGHNPMGAYMVILLLSLLVVQLVTGLFATDDIFTEGPLYSYVSSDLASNLTWVHKQNFNLILGFACVHILAVFVYLFKGDNLIKAMITGYKQFQSQNESPKIKSIWLATIVACAVFASVWFTLLADAIRYM